MGRNAITIGGNIGQLGGTFTPIPGGAAIGRCIGMAAGAAIIWWQSQSQEDEDDDPCKDALNRCNEAADEGGTAWTNFCTASAYQCRIDYTRPPRCHAKFFSSVTGKKNFCYNEFGG